ncbi:hypothetical protein ACJ72_06436 [Emergomyces africanus]|uniref:F-box domain-containing protein n=1 Tax=Emergomyces africanus TaxID=1955775 RepID=A0A1B7NR53_9EURO|nr:hypothetical protein ACJ72_06436 [Emergomyces africanus]
MSTENTLKTEAHSNSSPALDTTPVKKIPEEILEQIFSIVALHPPVSSWHDSRYKETLAVMLVCRRWHRIAEPLLYRRIKFGQSETSDPLISLQDGRRLLQSLKRKPYLSNYIRDVTIGSSFRYGHNESTGLYEVSDVFNELVPEILRYCNETVVLWICELSSASSVLEAIKKLPLKSLSIQRVNYSLFSDVFFNWLVSLRSLEELHIGTWRKHSSLPLNSLPTSLRGQSNIKIFKLDETNTCPTFTESCLALPAALEEVSLRGLRWSRSDWHYSTDEIQALLVLHRDSLRRIRVSYLDTSGLLPTFAIFPRLEQLFLCAYQVFGKEKPTELYLKLCAPNLKLLILHVDAEVTHSLDSESFSETEVEWLEQFASAHSQTLLAKKFCELHVIFFPVVECSKDLSWPWDRLDRAAEIVSKHGIKLTYSEPTSREEWAKQVAEQVANNSEHIEQLEEREMYYLI